MKPGTNISRQLRITLSLTIITCFAVHISGCKKDDDGGLITEPTAAEVATQLLTHKSWSVQSVTIDGVDQSSSFAGLTLQFSNSSFSSNGTSIVWPTTGTWDFNDETAKSITRSDGVTFNIQTLTESSLVVDLVWNKTTLGPGKTSSIAGTHVFTFN